MLAVTVGSLLPTLSNYNPSSPRHDAAGSVVLQSTRLSILRVLYFLFFSLSLPPPEEFFMKAGTPHPHGHSRVVGIGTLPNEAALSTRLRVTPARASCALRLVPSCLRPTCLCGTAAQCRQRWRTTHTGPPAQSSRPGSFVGTLEGAGLCIRADGSPSTGFQRLDMATDMSNYMPSKCAKNKSHEHPELATPSFQ